MRAGARGRARRSAVLGGLAGLVAGAACHQAGRAAATPPAPAPASHAPASPTPALPASVVAPPANAAPGSATPDSATVAQVLDGAVPAGRLAQVTGRCLGYGGRADAGPPPRTRSDWLLGDGGRAVYVVGAFPAGCQPMGGGPDRLTVVARVAVDTAAGLGGPGVVRRYLVRRP